jgi:hypothetical protein
VQGRGRWIEARTAAYRLTQFTIPSNALQSVITGRFIALITCCVCAHWPRASAARCLRELRLVRLLQSGDDPSLFGLKFGGPLNGRISDAPHMRAPALFLLDQIDQAIFSLGHNH